MHTNNLLDCYEFDVFYELEVNIISLQKEVSTI